MASARSQGLAVITGDRMNILMWMQAFELQTGGLVIPGGAAVMEAHFQRLLDGAAKL